MVSLVYPVFRLNWALFSVVILFHHWFPLLENFENWIFFCPATSLQFGSFLHDKYFTSMWMFLQIGPLGPRLGL